MLRNYIKVALKVLLRRKFFTFISLFGICFTLLVLTVVAALYDHTFAPHAPETRLARSLGVHSLGMRGEHSSWGSNPGYGFLDRHVRTLEGVEKVTVFSEPESVKSYHEGRKIEISRKRTDGAFWEVFDFTFIEGGPFGAEDDRDGNFVAVINEASRDEFFFGEPALGRKITVDGQTFRIVGVVRDVAILQHAPYADLWVPIGTSKSSGYRASIMGGFNAVIVAHSRADFRRIKEDFQDELGKVQIPDPERYDVVYGGADTRLESMARGIFEPEGLETGANRIRAIALGAVLLFMLLPSINLVNLNLSRILERASEIGVRKAFGASSRSLVSQFVVENVILTLIGGLLAFVLSGPILYIINESQLIPYSQFRLNLRVFGYGLLIATFFGLLSGVYPAWKMSRLHPVEALRGKTS